MTRFPHDRFDDVTDGPRVGAHRGSYRRGRGWIAFAWAALATGVLVGIGVLVLALLNGSYSFNGDSSSPAPSASSSATSTAAPSGEPSAGSSSEAAAASPSDQGSTTLVVLNGTSTRGLAATATTKLTTAGWKVTSSGNAGTTGTPSTIVYYQQESQAALAKGIAASLGVSAVQQSSAFPNADVSVVLGADFTG
ncbi:LytR C-terminal domain-containing protein [Curtobacterium sp. 9128]|uniref:LytR C-terminal domain-containing protein n=1 Tax=Curtobacterium sp. 9128 TaxID=1793722 RepID=UPI0011A0BFE8|nr:LytR C-terminal domain-containing protein [Curtobacterium sp. 9128]